MSLLIHAIVVMGVSGCGKTTVASRLAQRLQWQFVEADAFHSAANIEKMRAGIPLSDEDRRPWLDAIATWITAARAQGTPCIVACSALKRSYRERLARGAEDVRFVYLRGELETVAARMAGRTGHYMPVSLLKSQFEALEEPGSDEDPIVLSIDSPVEALLDEIVATLS
jgi:gluconokinase